MASMFCCECDYAIGTGARWVKMPRVCDHSDWQALCLECAIQMDWLRHGQPIFEAGRECRTCGEPECHGCDGVLSADTLLYARGLCQKHDRATAPYVPRTEHEHKRQSQLARAIRGRLDRMGARTFYTESGLLRIKA
jgi:hypothetical protein